MEVMVPSATDFNFDSTASTPYVSAPSSPKRFGGDPFDYYYHYTSAPTSPSRVAAIFASSSVPLDWDHKPNSSPPADDDFAFDFSGQLEKGLPMPDLTDADVLFEKGKIRPLKPPPRLYNPSSDAASTPRSPKSPARRRWSPRTPTGNKEIDPFTAAMVETTRERGRERGKASSNASQEAATTISSSRSRKGSRSLSPMRSGVGGFFSRSSDSAVTSKESKSTIASECLKARTSGGSNSNNGKKWRLRDLLLFRSASEGRVTGNKSKDPLRKYTLVYNQTNSPVSSPSSFRKGGEDSRNSSFRSSDGGGSIRRSTGQAVSAHEIHYVSNRVASEEMKKKTALPFNRQGLFGCLRFNPAVNSIARGFHNSCSFGRRQ